MTDVKANRFDGILSYDPILKGYITKAFDEVDKLLRWYCVTLRCYCVAFCIAYALLLRCCCVAVALLLRCRYVKNYCGRALQLDWYWWPKRFVLGSNLRPQKDRENEPGQTYKPGQTHNKPGQTGAGPCQSFLVQNLNQKDWNLVTNTSGRAFHCLGLMGHMNICLFLVIFWTIPTVPRGENSGIVIRTSNGGHCG